MQSGPFSPSTDQELLTSYDVIRLWELEAPLAYLAEHGADVEAVVTSVQVGLPAEVIACLPGLRVICSWGVGYETVAVAAARARGIPVSNTPRVLDGCVADLAWGLLIATVRRISEGDRYVRAGQWRAIGGFPLAPRVSGKRLGVLGLGRIGQAIARRGLGFDMDVRYHNRNPRADTAYDYVASLPELAAWADFLVVACIGGPGTHHLVSAEVIEALGPRGILVNIARGSVVDEAALVKALLERRLAGAGLDVFEGEPRVPKELLGLDNVVLTPHVGSSTVETRQAMDRLVLDNLSSFMRTGTLLTPIPD